MKKTIFVWLFLSLQFLLSPALYAQQACIQAHASKAPSTHSLRVLQEEIFAVDPEAQALFEEGAFQSVVFRMRNRGESDLARRLEDWIELELQHGEIVQTEELKGQTTLTTVFVARYQSGMKAILKLNHRYMRRGGRGYEIFCDLLAEVAAYRFSRLIGFDAVAVTVNRDFDLKKKGYSGLQTVSLQAFISPTAMEAHPELSQIWADGKRKIRIFDYLVNNRDRNDDNFFPSLDLLAAIDHGGAFKEESVTIGTYPPLPLAKLPADERYASFFQSIQQVTDAQLIEALSGLVSERAISELLVRRRNILRQFQSNMTFRLTVRDYEVEPKQPPSRQRQRQLQQQQQVLASPPIQPATQQKQDETSAENPLLNPFLWNPFLNMFRR